VPAPGAAPAATGAPEGTAAPGGTPAPAAAAPDRAVDQARHDEIVAMMRDPARSREYWGNPGVQQEYREVLTRLEPAAGAEPPGAIAGDPGNVAAPGPADGSAFRI
jgi:hypothetical protein